MGRESAGSGSPRNGRKKRCEKMTVHLFTAPFKILTCLQARASYGSPAAGRDPVVMEGEPHRSIKACSSRTEICNPNPRTAIRTPHPKTYHSSEAARMSACPGLLRCFTAELYFLSRPDEGQQEPCFRCHAAKQVHPSVRGQVTQADLHFSRVAAVLLII